MKTIFIGTDSRGSVADHASKQSRDTSWTERFKTKYPDNTYICRRSAMEVATHCLYDCDILENVADKSIDLAILHTAMNSGIEYYSPAIFQGIFPKWYTPDGLKHPQEGNRFIYSHLESEKYIFNLLNKKAKHTIWIGLHSMERYADFNPPRSKTWKPTFSELAKYQNAWYGSLVTNLIELPWDEKWVDENTHPDHLHYIEPGVSYILNKLAPIAEKVLVL